MFRLLPALSALLLGLGTVAPPMATAPLVGEQVEEQRQPKDASDDSRDAQCDKVDVTWTLDCIGVRNNVHRYTGTAVVNGTMLPVYRMPTLLALRLRSSPRVVSVVIQPLPVGAAVAGIPWFTTGPCRAQP